jgi:hypothetical protein
MPLLDVLFVPETLLFPACSKRTSQGHGKVRTGGELLGNCAEVMGVCEPLLGGQMGSMCEPLLGGQMGSLYSPVLTVTG